MTTQIQQLQDNIQDIPDDIEVPVKAGLVKGLIDSLERIRREEGKVCGMFEICKHGSCMSSYSAWAIADEVLNP